MHCNGGTSNHSLKHNSERIRLLQRLSLTTSSSSNLSLAESYPGLPQAALRLTSACLLPEDLPRAGPASYRDLPPTTHCRFTARGRFTASSDLTRVPQISSVHPLYGPGRPQLFTASSMRPLRCLFNACGLVNASSLRLHGLFRSLRRRPGPLHGLLTVTVSYDLCRGKRLRS